MTIEHHPSELLLLDYATGALGEAWSIAVATHLALCPECRQTVAFMEEIGGSLLESVEENDSSMADFDALLARIDHEPDRLVQSRPATESAHANLSLPQPLRGYLGCDADEVPWKRLGKGAYQCLIPTNDGRTTARLLRIPAGRPVPEHSHGGLELTLVLRGAFTDDTGIYGRGDFQEADEKLQHQPHAADGEDCICLAVTDAPLRFTSLAARLIQPVIGI